MLPLVRGGVLVCKPSSVEVLVVVWLRAYPSVVRRCLREEFGTPLLYKSSSVEVPSMGVLGGQDSGLEILLGEGGDVELGARTSEHIFVFTFDPLVSKLSLYIVQSIIHHSYHTCLHLCCALHISYCYILYILGCLCVPHLYLINKSFI